MIEVFLVLQNYVCGCTEIGGIANAVSVPWSKVISNAEEPQAEISGGDEDERVPL